MLNGQPMGGKRRSAHYYDLWNMKYLPKFKWDHLTEEITYQKAVREQRLSAEVAAAKRERDFYLSRVDKAKAMDAMTERRKRKAEASVADDIDRKSTGDGKEGQQPEKVLRTFQQRQTKADPAIDKEAATVSNKILELIAGSKKQKSTRKD